MFRLLLMVFSLFSLLGLTDGGDKAPADDKDKGGDPPWLAGLANLIARNGGNTSVAAEILYKEKYEQRERIRELEGKVPPAGAVVLTAEQAAQWQAYQGLGAPDALTAALKERDDAKGELAKTQRERTLQQAAEVYGYNPAVLAKLPGFEQPVALKERTENGKVIRTAVVQAEGGEVPLNELVQRDYAEFLPALQPNQPKGTQGKPFPATAPSGGGGTRTAGQSYVASAYKKNKEAS